MLNSNGNCSNSSSTNFLSQFRDKKSKKFTNLTATQFAQVWNHYDKDGNGFIEGEELDLFLKEFISSLLSEKVQEDAQKTIISDAAMKALKEEILEAYDENADGRIEMCELAQLLPMEETFLLFFRKDNPMESSVDFMKAWRTFDKNQSGYIEANELKEFLRYLLKESSSTSTNYSVEEEKLEEYTRIILQLFDHNKDGKLQLSEMSRLLPVKENFLCRSIFKVNANRITRFEIERLFSIYDQDKNGSIENEELDGFLKDLMEVLQEDYDNHDLQFMKKTLLSQWNKNGESKITKEDLKLILVQQNRLFIMEQSLKNPT